MDARFSLTLFRKTAFYALWILAAAPSWAAISDEVIKIGLFTDLTGVYSGFTGKGSVIAAEMAIADAGETINGKPIKLLVADHKNDKELASRIARDWLEKENVDVIADVVGSPIALAVQEINKTKKAVLFFNSVVTTALTGKNCAETGVHWMYDANSFAAVSGGAITRRGGDTWFFITVDNDFGMNAERIYTNFIVANHGKVLGHARHPINTEDFSVYLLKAQMSGAKVIAFANAGEDAINGIKQSFDLRGVAKGKTQIMAAVGITDIHRIKLPLSQGMQTHASFYWNLDAKTAAWSNRYFALRGEMPHDVHAGIYSSLMHYFKAVKSLGSDDGPSVVKAMRTLPIDSPLLRNAQLRPDGRMVHDVYLVQVKKPSESKKPWDYFNVLQVIPGSQAFGSLEASECPLINKNAAKAQK
ncbi:ABC transporter substrate-binding protein [Janthinobacterium sp. 17J80-10]|uniref:ABC transporter substrate-binding protein n=1 Tax=Janthinobacterium sp. 17J80-10 TaxID=2497863 RepID=UPI00100551EA|nr:ABC transporter substrate-binding protein [Janthinobacterium sp. 17J80-10]QAU35323.1 ABC transporter substrate-binding protein [Janthinobacterium sp. 17J80-10]